MVGIYKGKIVDIQAQNEMTVNIIDDGLTNCIHKNEIIIIEDETFKAVEKEYISVKEEQNNLSNRILKLDEAYQTKKEMLRELLMDARQKEISIISKLINSAKIINDFGKNQYD